MASFSIRCAAFPLMVSLVMLTGLGCGKGPKGGPRVATYPITGTVTIDGKPEAQVRVLCHPVGAAGVPIGSAAFTDAEGKFSIGTYESSDGAPAGEYKLTFFWGQINLMTGRYDGPDKLQDRYSDPDTSGFTVTVSEGVESEPVEATLTTQ